MNLARIAALASNGISIGVTSVPSGTPYKGMPYVTFYGKSATRMLGDGELFFYACFRMPHNRFNVVGSAAGFRMSSDEEVERVTRKIYSWA